MLSHSSILDQDLLVQGKPAAAAAEAEASWAVVLRVAVSQRTAAAAGTVVVTAAAAAGTVAVVAVDTTVAELPCTECHQEECPDMLGPQ